MLLSHLFFNKSPIKPDIEIEATENKLLKASTTTLKVTVARDLLLFLLHLFFSKSPIKPVIEIEAKENQFVSRLIQQFLKGQ